MPPPKSTFPWPLLGCLDCTGARKKAYLKWKKAPNIPFRWEKSEACGLDSCPFWAPRDGLGPTAVPWPGTKEAVAQLPSRPASGLHFIRPLALAAIDRAVHLLGDTWVAACHLTQVSRWAPDRPSGL